MWNARSRVLLSLGISILLIGTVSWYRFNTDNPTQAELEYVESVTGGDKWPNILADTSIASTTKTVDLTNSDIIGRSLLAEYINTTINTGSNDQNSLDNLVSNYIETIPTLITIDKVSIGDLKVVPVSKPSLEKYYSEMGNAYSTYVNNLASVYSSRKPSGNMETRIDFAVYSYPIYEKWVSQIKNVSVPSILADKHVELVNIGLSNMESTKALQNSDKDAAKAFAGMVKLGENFDKEQAVIQDIQRILTSNGL